MRPPNHRFLASEMTDLEAERTKGRRPRRTRVGALTFRRRGRREVSLSSSPAGACGSQVLDCEMGTLQPTWATGLNEVCMTTEHSAGVSSWHNGHCHQALPPLAIRTRELRGGRTWLSSSALFLMVWARSLHSCSTLLSLEKMCHISATVKAAESIAYKDGHCQCSSFTQEPFASAPLCRGQTRTAFWVF